MIIYVQAYPHVKTVAILQPDEPGGQFFMGVTQREAEAHGLKVVVNEFHNPLEQQDFYPVLTKVLAAKPDAVDVWRNTSNTFGA